MSSPDIQEQPGSNRHRARLLAQFLGTIAVAPVNSGRSQVLLSALGMEGVSSSASDALDKQRKGDRSVSLASLFAPSPPQALKEWFLCFGESAVDAFATQFLHTGIPDLRLLPLGEARMERGFERLADCFDSPYDDVSLEIPAFLTRTQREETGAWRSHPGRASVSPTIVRLVDSAYCSVIGAAAGSIIGSCVGLAFSDYVFVPAFISMVIGVVVGGIYGYHSSKDYQPR